MVRRSLYSFALAAALAGTQAAQAAGMLFIDPIIGGPLPVVPVRHVNPAGHPTPRPGSGVRLKGGVSFGLRMQSAAVETEITDQVAKTYVCQTFINDTDRNLAGTYLFPLPDDTTYSSFSLHIDGKPVEGNILEAKQARAQYEQIVRQLVDPGLLEYADYKTVRVRIFPIPAHGTKKVELEYTQLLKADNGMFKYAFPLKTENDSAPSDELKVQVKLSSQAGLRTIWSPSHTVTVSKDNDHCAQVAFLARDTVPDKDFVLYYSVSGKDLAANLLTHKSAGEDGYYLLTLTPPVEAKAISNKDILFVIDTSGSMQGDRIEQSKKALKYLIGDLHPGDRFNLIGFNTDIQRFREALVPATADTKRQASAFVGCLEARGGTNLGDALKQALTMINRATADRPVYLVLMTDGVPTVGETAQAEILKDVASTRDVRLFDFGVGYDINTQLLNKLAEDHHGTAEYVEPNEDLETALSSLSHKIKSPVLTNVKIAYNGIETRQVYPREVKDIFAGSQVMLLGRYQGQGDASVHLTGTINGVQKSYTFPVVFAVEQIGNTYLPRLWAMRRIGYLTEVAQSNGNAREVVDEIVSLSKKYGIISQYTSFLVTDPNERNAHGMPVGSFVAARDGDPGGTGGGGWDLGPDDSFPSLANKAADADLGSYMANLQRQLKKHWYPPKGNESKKIVTVFTIRKDGSISNARIARSSGVAIADQAALRAVQESTGSLKTLPAGAPESVDLEFTFDSNVFNLGTSWRSFDAPPLPPPPLPGSPGMPLTGKAAVVSQKAINNLKNTIALAPQSSDVRTIAEKTFTLQDGYWTDAAYDGKQKLTNISFGSKEYFDLLQLSPGIGRFLSVGRNVILIYNGRGYKISYKSA